MNNRNSGTATDMYGRYFPGEAYVTTFTPTPDQSSAMIRLATSYADNNSQADVLLMMLGVLPSESVFNAKGRDAWSKAKPTVTDTGVCRNGHVREVHTYRTSAGVLRCRECRRISESARGIRQREKEKV